MSNKLINETSPYLLQHAHNPVNWYPWGKEAFDKAKTEDKPIFLSIGYSTCHWCHVMEHESFEDNDVARVLNESFVSIKVDKEERPDVDSIYMNVCQSLTGSGGWPLTIIMTPEQKPFYAGTYFPKQSRYGLIGILDLLLTVKEKWKTNRADLIKSGNEITDFLNQKTDTKSGEPSKKTVEKEVEAFKNAFDINYGGFGSAPKFPTPHNLMLLLRYYSATKDAKALEMVEVTLEKMYRGGMFDHIGFGFSRYSTDKMWLIPHFEKMLYDNALLTIAYLEAYQLTKNELYKKVAVKIMDYVARELTSPEGGLYCAQDADSEGVEGKYYAFTQDEIVSILGKDDGDYFNKYFDITKEGNFEGKNIPNLIKTKVFDERAEQFLQKVYDYRRSRTQLHKDDKILTSWNALMLCAYALAYRILGDKKYLDCALKDIKFIQNNLSESNKLFVSFRNGKRSDNGFLDDYAFYIWALIEMYNATFDNKYLDMAQEFSNKAILDFWDNEGGGFYLYGKDGEDLILKPKEVYDGAIPSGNSVMAYNLIRLARITKNDYLEELSQKQIRFLLGNAGEYPSNFSFYMLSLLLYLYPSRELVCVLKDRQNLWQLSNMFGAETIITMLDAPTDDYPLKNDKTTYYLCENHSCLPPTNDIEMLKGAFV